MRALVLLLLCVVLLAVLQASYIVTEAKKHEEMREMDRADKEAAKQLKHEKKLRRKQRKGEDRTDLESADTMYPEEQKVNNDDSPADAAMPRDQPASERGGRRERVSKEERRARKEERKAAKAERQEGRKQQNGGRAERKKDKAERKAARQQKKAEKQAARGGGGGGKQQRVSCTSEADCGDGECCVPKRGGEMMCKANRKPRKAAKKCVTSCTCEGDLQCYAETPAADAPENPRNRNLGKCVAPSDADLTLGSILTAESRVAAAAAAAAPAA